MNQLANSEINQKLYKINGIRLCAFLGGPLGAFYLISKNYEVFGDKLAAKKNLFYGIFISIILFGLLFLIPDKIANRLPHYIFPLVCAALVSAYANKLQGGLIKEKLTKGTPSYSILRILGVSLLSFAISLVFLFFIVLTFKVLSITDIEYQLGWMYQQGKIVPQNDAEAIKWFNKAAARNDADAQNNLGVAYHLGKGVPQNDVVAAQWYLKSAEQGNVTAQNNLSYAYFNGQGVAQNYNEAIVWIRKSAEQGNPVGQYVLAQAFHNGTGVPQNEIEAFKWLQLAAEHEEVDAQYTLGMMYHTGQGVIKDDVEAVKWFRKAAYNGSSDGQYMLGFAYYAGKVGPANNVEAKKWFLKSAAQGNSSAKEMLNVLAKEVIGVKS